MKIAHIIPSLASGGAERITVDICNEMAKENRVFLIQVMQDQKKEFSFYRNQVNSNVSYICIGGKLNKLLDLTALFKLYALLKKIKPDVVHTHLNISYSFIPSLLKPKVSFFHTIHNEANVECLVVKGVTLKKISRFFFARGFIKPITISHESQVSYNKFYKLSNSILVQNGCYKKNTSSAFDQVTQFFKSIKHNKHDLVFINIGRSSEQKNHSMLVNVFNQLIYEGNPVKLLIIGDGFDSDKGKLLQEKSSEGIYFLGPKENVGDYLLLSDGFCLSSLWEGLPISLLEALSAGLYSISTPAGGVPTVLESEEIGLISDDFSDLAYYTAVKKFIDLKRNYDKKSIITYFEKKYDITKTITRLLTIYRK